MTAQIGDRYKFKNRDHTIVARSATKVFHPSEYGIMPEAACTACWNGFWCVYSVTDDGIFLEDLYVNSKDDHYPPIEGVLPEQQNGNASYMGHHRYAGLNIRLPYTGRILLSDGSVYVDYIHMGNHHPWAYKELVELVFEEGKLIETNDQSHIAAKIREKIRSDDSIVVELLKLRFGLIQAGEIIEGGDDIWWL